MSTVKNLISEAFSCLVILQINWKGTPKPKLYEKKKMKKKIMALEVGDNSTLKLLLVCTDDVTYTLYC